MPDLAEDLRHYFDELARRVEEPLDHPDLDEGGSQPVSHRRRARRSPVLATLVVALVVLVALAGAVLASRGSTTGPLEVTGPTEPAPEPGSEFSMTIEPTGPLHDGDTLQLHATGFAPGQMIAIVTCAGTQSSPDVADCDLETIVQVPADAEGDLVASYPVRRLIRVRGAYDCGSEPGGCEIAIGPVVLSPTEPTVGITAVVTFAVGPAAPLPAITMTPNSDLHDGQTVTVAGTDFAPDLDVLVTECPPSTDCGYLPFGVTAHTDATGAFSQQLTLHRSFTVAANEPNGATQVTLDCTTGCTVNAVESGPASALSATPLPFALVG